MIESTKLFQEIHEQPAALQRFLTEERLAVAELAAAIVANEIHYVLIAARGTSDNAGRYAKYLFGAVNHLPVALATPSLFSVYNSPPRLRNALVLGISQSGKSPDIVSVLSEARSQGAMTAAITNNPDSNLAAEADQVIALHAGEEKSIAATKTYTSSLIAIAALSAAMAQQTQMTAQLESIPDAVAAGLAVGQQVASLTQRYRYMRHCVVIGRGYNYASAFELALKLKELTYTIAEPYSSADFLHGPLALLEPGFPAIVFAPTGMMLAETKAFVEVLRARGAEPIVVSDDADALAHAQIGLPIAQSVPEWLSPITAIVPGQLFAMYLAHTRGLDPDHPRALSKVTETR